jgi:LPS-assembly protein
VMRGFRTSHRQVGTTRSSAVASGAAYDCCGSVEQGRHAGLGGYARAIGLVLGLLAASAVTSRSFAQDPSVIVAPTTASGGSFPKTAGGPLGGPLQRVDGNQPLYLQGDELIYDTKGSKVVARGNVEIFYNNYLLKSDEVTYDQAASTLTAVGNVELREPNGNIIRADRYTLTDDFKDGFAQSLSLVTKDESRIAGERAIRRDGNVTEFQNGKFTPCKSDPGKPPLWCISATRIMHDQPNATVTYQDAYFEVFGQKILYLPYFQHADPSVKRRSGFLMPSYMSSTTLGMGVEVPYYFALSPSYDLTVRPMFLAKQGILMQADWRQKLAFGNAVGEYTISAAGIDQTSFNSKVVNSTLPDHLRGSVQTRGKFSLSSWWKFGWDVTVESDDTFRRFYKLDDILQTDRVNTVYLQGLGERSHFSITGYQLGGLLLSDTSSSASWIRPVVDWNYIMNQPVLGGELGWNVNAASLARTDGLSKATSVFTKQTSEVNRVSADVNWRRRLTDQVGITYTPFVNVRGDVTQLKNVIDPTSVGTVVDPLRGTLTTGAIENETQTRGVASAGVMVNYPWIASTANASHVIEPIGQLIGRTAKANQQRLPDEDAKSLVLDDTNLFEVSKFSGYDRVETGTRANVGLQYSFQSNSGGSARILVGQSFHLSGENAYATPGLDIDRKPLFTRNSGLETSRSDYVLGVHLAPTPNFRALGQMRFDEATFALNRADLMAQASYGPFSVTAGYGFASADPLTGSTVGSQQLVGTTTLRLSERWGLSASLVYDLNEKFVLQDSIALKYTDECFALSTTYTESFINNPAKDIVPDRTVMFRFGLKYLGDFGYKTNNLELPFSTVNQPITR